MVAVNSVETNSDSDSCTVKRDEPILSPDKSDHMVPQNFKRKCGPDDLPHDFINNQETIKIDEDAVKLHITNNFPTKFMHNSKTITIRPLEKPIDYTKWAMYLKEVFASYGSITGWHTIPFVGKEFYTNLKHHKNQKKLRRYLLPVLRKTII
uniref:HSF_DOMAIN domain-containing protein n=1 Tax=Rhabditophanes sp. KR3021 TaxID=114890 RepID=A0AC35TTZ6_9BILA